MDERPTSGIISDAAAHELLKQDFFSQLLGITIVEVGPAHVKLSLTVSESLTNGLGICHGGVMFSLADTALAFCAATQNLSGATIAADIRYFHQVRNGDTVIACATPEHVGQRVATFSTLLHVDKVLVAAFRGTAYGKVITLSG